MIHILYFSEPLENNSGEEVRISGEIANKWLSLGCVPSLLILIRISHNLGSDVRITWENHGPLLPQSHHSLFLRLSTQGDDLRWQCSSTKCICFIAEAFKQTHNPEAREFTLLIIMKSFRIRAMERHSNRQNILCYFSAVHCQSAPEKDLDAYIERCSQVSVKRTCFSMTSTHSASGCLYATRICLLKSLLRAWPHDEYLMGSPYF